MDNVNHPAHYKFPNGAEVIDLTENLSFNLGNVVKYVARAGRKTGDPAEDLAKAQFYLNREIQRLTAVEDADLKALREKLAGWREWSLLDHVPPNTIVQDRDGDQYRRINGTSKFQFRYADGSGGWGEWRDTPGFVYKDQAILAPFREVTDG